MTVIRRHAGNPILTQADVPCPVATVHNARAVKYDGRYLLLFRSHRRNGRSIIGLAESDDGLRFSVRPEPFLVPATEGVFAEYEEWGVEDVRVCPMEGEYMLTYSCLLYTSDAADDLTRVDLGGRRIIKKKK